MNKSIFEKMIILNCRFKNKIFSMMLSKCLYKSGKKCSFMRPFVFKNLHKVQIGSNVTIHPFCWLIALDDPTIIPRSPQIVFHDSVSLGMNSTISSVYHIEIGSNVLIAPNVYISDHSHNYVDTNKPIRDQGLSKVLPVSIGEDSWIGHGVVITPGVKIGKHCIIGANSVVNQSIPDFSIAVGAPAKVIKSIGKGIA